MLVCLTPNKSVYYRWSNVPPQTAVCPRHGGRGGKNNGRGTTFFSKSTLLHSWTGFWWQIVRIFADVEMLKLKLFSKAKLKWIILRWDVIQLPLLLSCLSLHIRGLHPQVGGSVCDDLWTEITLPLSLISLISIFIIIDYNHCHHITSHPYWC